MGATYDAADHSYTVGLLALCALAVVAFLFTLVALPRNRRTEPDPATARG